MNAKRLVSCVCALAVSSASFMTGFVSAADTADVTLKGAQIEVEAGSKFELAIDLAGLAGDAKDGFSGCEFAITYDPSKIEKVQITEGGALSKTGATGAELNKAPTIGSEVSMVNKSDYNCFDYNIVAKEGSDTTVAILWCTGLESSDYWVKEAGTLFTFKGTLTENAKPGDVIPVKIVPISRDENSKMVFGHIDGEKDVKFSSAAEDGQITVKEKSGAQLKPTLWGDLDVNGAVTAADLVAMVQFILDPDIAHVSDQGIVNGDLFHADGKATDVKSDDVLDANDLFLLKKLILEDLGQEDFPMEKLS